MEFEKRKEQEEADRRSQQQLLEMEFEKRKEQEEADRRSQQQLCRKGVNLTKKGVNLNSTFFN
jgi:hypothetical protein